MDWLIHPFLILIFDWSYHLLFSEYWHLLSQKNYHIKSSFDNFTKLNEELIHFAQCMTDFLIHLLKLILHCFSFNSILSLIELTFLFDHVTYKFVIVIIFELKKYRMNINLDQEGFLLLYLHEIFFDLLNQKFLFL